MADKIIEVPGVGNIAFPETMSDDAIASAISSQHKDLAAQQRKQATAAIASAPPSIPSPFNKIADNIPNEYGVSEADLRQYDPDTFQSDLTDKRPYSIPKALGALTTRIANSNPILRPLTAPLDVAKTLAKPIIKRGAASIDAYTHQSADSLDPNDTTVRGLPDSDFSAALGKRLAKDYRNFFAPAGRSATRFATSMVEPENAAMLAGFALIPTATVAGKALHTAINAYFAGTMGPEAVMSAYDLYKSSQKGDIAANVEKAFDLFFNGAMALDTIKGAAETGDAAFTQVKGNKATKQLIAKFMRSGDADALARYMQFAAPTQAHPETLPSKWNPESHLAPKDEVHVSPLDEQIVQLHRAKGGSSVSEDGVSHVGEHTWAVSLFPERTIKISGRDLTPADIANFRARNADLLSHANTVVGTWRDANGTHWLDISYLTPNKNAAVSLGKLTNQEAITRLSDFNSVQLGGDGSVPSNLPTIDNRFFIADNSSPSRSRVRGQHFSLKPVTSGVLEGARRGSSGVGAEVARLQHKNTPAPNGSYFYDAGTQGEPLITARPHSYSLDGNYAIARIGSSGDEVANRIWKQAYDAEFARAKSESLPMPAGMPGKRPTSDAIADQRATNAAEEALRDAGYDGYRNTDINANAFFLFGDHPVMKTGEVAAPVVAKPAQGKSHSLADAPAFSRWEFSPEHAADLDAIASSIPGAITQHSPDASHLLVPREALDQASAAFDASPLHSNFSNSKFRRLQQEVAATRPQFDEGESAQHLGSGENWSNDLMDVLASGANPRTLIRAALLNMRPKLEGGQSASDAHFILLDRFTHFLLSHLMAHPDGYWTGVNFGPEAKDALPAMVAQGVMNFLANERSSGRLDQASFAKAAENATNFVEAIDKAFNHNGQAGVPIYVHPDEISDPKFSQALDIHERIVHGGQAALSGGSEPNFPFMDMAYFFRPENVAAKKAELRLRSGSRSYQSYNQGSIGREIFAFALSGEAYRLGVTKTELCDLYENGWEAMRRQWGDDYLLNPPQQLAKNFIDMMRAEAEAAPQKREQYAQEQQSYIDRVNATRERNASNVSPAGLREDATQLSANLPSDARVPAQSRNAATKVTGVDGTAADARAAGADNPVTPQFRESERPRDARDDRFSYHGMYLKSEKVADTLPNKGNSLSFLNKFLNAGVKKEEMYWTGLDDFLKGKKGEVTKQEVQDYLKKNRLELQEVVHGKDPVSEEAKQEAHDIWQREQKRANDLYDELSSNEETSQFTSALSAAARGHRFPEAEERLLAKIPESMRYTAKSFIEAERNAQELNAKYVDLYNANSSSMQSPKFSRYSLPNGQNYREILITMPEKETGDSGRREDFEPLPEVIAKHQSQWDSLTQQIRKLDDQYEEVYQDKSLAPLVQRDALHTINSDRSKLLDERDKLHWKMVDESTKIRHANAVANRPAYQNRMSDSPWMYENHWDEPNVLVHARVTERTDPDTNKKIFFIEEIQSDLHAKGREHGYGDPSNPKQWTKNDFDIEEVPIAEVAKEQGMSIYQQTDGSYRNYNDRFPADFIAHRFRLKGSNDAWSYSLAKDFTPESLVEGVNNQAAQGWLPPSAIRDANTKRRDIVPDFPFKDNGYRELALKRLIHEASERGFDHISWTTGRQQAERYNLAEHGVTRLEFAKYRSERPSDFTKFSDDGDAIYFAARNEAPFEGNLVVYNGNTPVRRIKIDSIAKLKETIGTDLAQRLLAQAPEEAPNGSGEEVRTLSDLDNVSIGGTGHDEAYDKILVNLMNKIGKRFGSQVRKSDVVTKEESKLVFTPSSPEGKSHFTPEELRMRATELIVDADTLLYDGTKELTPEAHAKAKLLTKAGFKLRALADRMEYGGYSFAYELAKELPNEVMFTVARALGGTVKSESSAKREPVWTLDITPDLRRSILTEGQPLFRNTEDAQHAFNSVLMQKAMEGAQRALKGNKKGVKNDFLSVFTALQSLAASNPRVETSFVKDGNPYVTNQTANVLTDALQKHALELRNSPRSSLAPVGTENAPAGGSGRQPQAAGDSSRASGLPTGSPRTRNRAVPSASEPLPQSTRLREVPEVQQQQRDGSSQRQRPEVTKAERREIWDGIRNASSKRERRTYFQRLREHIAAEKEASKVTSSAVPSLLQNIVTR